MDRRIITFKEAKELGVWSDHCKREGWKEERVTERVSDDMKFSIDEDLFHMTNDERVSLMNEYYQMKLNDALAKINSGLNSTIEIVDDMKVIPEGAATELLDLIVEKSNELQRKIDEKK